MNKTAVILVSTAVLALAGCGIKGPLYVPGVPKDAPWPYPSPPPAPEPAAPKVPDVPGTTDEKK